MPDVSIIVPVLNEARGIARLLQDLGPWRDAGDEVIVVDGGSEDATVEAAAPRCDRMVCAPRGRASQLNAGAAAARARILWFVHADTGIAPGARDALLDACAGDACWGRFDVRIDDPAPVFAVIGALMNLRSRVTGIATGDQGMFVTRSLFETVGGYPPIALMEDVELSRALRAYASPRRLPRLLTTSARRWRKHGIARTVLTMWGLRLAHAAGTSPDRLARLYGYR